MSSLSKTVSKIFKKKYTNTKFTTKPYDDQVKKFKNSVNSFIKRLIKKLDELTTKTVYFSNSKETLNLKDNTIYQYNGGSGVKELTIVYPKGNFVSTVLFTTAREGTIVVNFKDKSRTSYVGYNELRFFNSENWELNIQNGRVVGNQIFKKNV